ncbi:type IV toxin-antitoxin system AbiEi family antitoxin [Glaciecola sp. SC05]|uniref:type IV toxin-antitoxin system AbiEi family antitoxin n=1 Tax=Glaciecola sp. SC05 TaxID=1987355 RepID=UPI003528C28C
MNKQQTLSRLTMQAKNDGHNGVFDTYDLAMMMQFRHNNKFSGFIGKASKNNTIKRVAKGLYINPLSPPNPRTAIYLIAKRLRWNVSNYVSLESQLSYLGIISQQLMGHVTIMTTGRKGIFKTAYGVIEFTHTMRSICELSDQLYYDEDIGMFRANRQRAIADLKRVGRNVNMIEEMPDAE